MRLIGVIGVMFVFGGCTPGAVPPDAPTEPDGAPHGRGMFVMWNADPALPGIVTDHVTVSDASFQIEHLQLISDAGADSRTTRSRYQLEWSPTSTPSPESFPDAPVAVYQKISLDLRPSVELPYAYQIEGTWRDDGSGEVKPFKIVDPVELSSPIDCSVTLPAGGSVSIALEVDLKEALEGIDFRTVDDEDGVLVLRDGPLLADLHSRMAQAFKLDE